ncbi:hypothetical protein DPMN_084157 [Dreissena polymorpha]|uniref:Uncharacterized protein n=1 Tax=Dreissena polymorpha TaxID=45954 RepID=A0A9D4BBS7_DREPO|nr:hypothetical protein DPMN_084157 [Dreissena polymorpha]
MLEQNRLRIMKLHVYIDHDSQMTSIDFEVTRIMKLHRYIDHDSQMTPIDFQVTRSEVKVTREESDLSCSMTVTEACETKKCTHKERKHDRKKVPGQVPAGALDISEILQVFPTQLEMYWYETQDRDFKSRKERIISSSRKRRQFERVFDIEVINDVEITDVDENPVITDVEVGSETDHEEGNTEINYVEGSTYTTDVEGNTEISAVERTPEINDAEGHTKSNVVNMKIFPLHDDDDTPKEEEIEGLTPSEC